MPFHIVPTRYRTLPMNLLHNRRPLSLILVRSFGLLLAPAVQSATRYR